MRPVREQDPEWFWKARGLTALTKAILLVGIGGLAGLALVLGGVWAVAFGTLAILATIALIHELRKAR